MRETVLLGLAFGRAGFELGAFGNDDGGFPTVIGLVAEFLRRGNDLILGTGLRREKRSCQQDGCADEQGILH